MYQLTLCSFNCKNSSHINIYYLQKIEGGLKAISNSKKSEDLNKFYLGIQSFDVPRKTFTPFYIRKIVLVILFLSLSTWVLVYQSIKYLSKFTTSINYVLIERYMSFLVKLVYQNRCHSPIQVIYIIESDTFITNCVSIFIVY